jgi:acyl carrier protein
MVPSAIVVLQRLPLTTSGKLDRQALPRPELTCLVEGDREQPSGEVEETLAAVWQSLLGVEGVSRDDNFFDLGGHSLLAMQLVARISSILAVDVPVKSVFDTPNLRTLSAYIEAQRHEFGPKRTSDDDELQELIERVAAMPDSQASELLRSLRTEGWR